MTLDPKTYTPTLPLIIDSTMLTTFRACPMKFYRSYVLRRRGQFVEAGTPTSAKPSLDLCAGGAFADGLEAYRIAFYGEGASHEESLHRAIIAATLRWDSRIDPFPPEFKSPHLVEAKSLPRVLYAIDQYFKHYPPSRDDFQPQPMQREGKVAFEFSGSLPLDRPSYHLPLHPSGNPFLLGFRLDGMGTWRHLPAWLDEKTTKSLGETWAQQWPMRNQFIAYRWALRELGYDHSYCVIRGVAFLKSEIKFAEHVQRYPDHLADRWLIELRRDLNDMVRYWETSDWPVRIGDACTSYGGCEFRDVCTSSPQHHPALLDTYGFNDWEPGTPSHQPALINLYKGLAA